MSNKTVHHPMGCAHGRKSTNFKGLSTKKNYLEEYVIEASAATEFLELIGRRRFNSLANQFEKVTDKIDIIEFSDEGQSAFQNLDAYFPVDDFQCALDYFKACARLVFAKRLYSMCLRIEADIQNKRPT